MRSIHLRGVSILALLALAAACADRGDLPTTPDRQVPAAGTMSQDQLRYERLARRFALALNDAQFRRSVYEEIQGSRIRERKVHLQAFLSPASFARGAVASAAGETSEAVGRDLDSQRDIEIYFPVADHRARWTGGRDLLVATAQRDGDIPVAYDTRGFRRELDPSRPPSTPVLALVPAEQSFAPGVSALIACLEACGDTGGGGTANTNVVPGLYMTATSFSGTFESWLKGDPEFEVHIMGQEGNTNTLSTVQCAGEKAGGPYMFDQNGKAWTGSVLLASQTQLDTYKAQHPGQAFRIMVVEDDDETCKIKMDENGFERVLVLADSFYRDLGGARDSTTGAGRVIKAARSGQKVLKAIWSWLTSADDMVGVAVEDVAAGLVMPGGNWIVKGENFITNGAIRLEMRGPK